MQRVASYQQNFKGLDFHFTTSSGDEIAINAFSKQELLMEHQKGKGAESLSLSLRESFGYSFSYKGDGIDEKDQEEIAKALKRIEPILKILDPKQESKRDDATISDVALDIRQFLPTPKDENHENFVKDELSKKMDEMLKAFKANDEMVELARDVFDALEAQMKGLSLYV